MPNKSAQLAILRVAVRRGHPIVCFYDFQGSTSPRIPDFERSEYIELKSPSVVYNVIQKSAWTVSKRLAAEVVFLSKIEVTNPTSGGCRSRQSIVSVIHFM
jgi:hypothetical protein